MSRMFASFAIALGCAVALHAQDTTTTTKTEVKGNDVKTVTYSGCMQTGTEPRSFVLAKVVPVGRTSTTESGCVIAQFVSVVRPLATASTTRG